MLNLDSNEHEQSLDLRTGERRPWRERPPSTRTLLFSSSSGLKGFSNKVCVEDAHSSENRGIGGKETVRRLGGKSLCLPWHRW